jgi:competence protein ComEC
MSKRKKKNSSGKVFIFLLLMGYLLYSIAVQMGYSFSYTPKESDIKKIKEIGEYVKEDFFSTIYNKLYYKLKTSDESLDGLEIQFIDVGQADAILIRSGKDNMLIDAGNNEDGKLLVNYLSNLGINDFKYVVGTHAHEDHIGGMDNVIRRFKIGQFYMPDAITTTPSFESVLDELDKKGYVYNVPEIGQKLKVGNAELTVIYTKDNPEDLNDSSIILLLEYDKVRALFTGDATGNVENEILDKNIRANILKVAHHGSRYSTIDKFLDKVNPQYAIISVGKDNDYGHPHEPILKKLKKRGIEVYRTDKLGTIILTTDGNKINIKSEKTETDGK